MMNDDRISHEEEARREKHRQEQRLKFKKGMQDKLNNYPLMKEKSYQDSE